MTDELRDALARLKGLCDAATPGPWRYWNNAGEPYFDVFGVQKGTLPRACTGVVIGSVNRVSADAADNELIARLRNAAPHLIDYALVAEPLIHEYAYLPEDGNPGHNWQECTCGECDAYRKAEAYQQAAAKLLEALK